MIDETTGIKAMTAGKLAIIAASIPPTAVCIGHNGNIVVVDASHRIYLGTIDFNTEAYVSGIMEANS